MVQAWTTFDRHPGIHSFPGNLWLHGGTNRRTRRYLTMRVGDADRRRDGSPGSLEPMANLYREWSLEQDQLLWENRQESTASIASLLGRGLRGVEARLSKLKDVRSPAYERLFADKCKKHKTCLLEDSQAKTKLIPASEVLRRVQYDHLLSPSDFYILHFDRVDDAIIESRMDAPNDSISGTATTLVDALPEHRIIAIKFREQVVWDREKRLDLVFGSGGIEKVMKEYEVWKRQRDDAQEWNRQQQAEVSERIRRCLGPESFVALKALSSSLQIKIADPKVSIKIEVERYVQKALNLFKTARDKPSTSLDPALIPSSDYKALDMLSELVALLPDSELRPMILTEIAMQLTAAEGKKEKVYTARELPELNEDDLTETFVRGSGPGGQKTNKTSNKVALLHGPTQLRVECQDTRSLQQNRKIARKRLRAKLDEFLNGNQSKSNLEKQKAASKKSKTKARNRARQRKREEAHNV